MKQRSNNGATEQVIQIKCAGKAGGLNPHERILTVGGVMADGMSWRLSQQQVIDYIESEVYSFCVSHNGQLHTVIVDTYQGNKYLKIRFDGVTPNSLLNLPECV
ncbi:hypothetical protein BN8_01796 [Fibrisoma limi BUZ 3]|uniref:DUF3892 domain-containing protein n=1 Tax=Fibrisoma limi BUZ 3 TaxID=1185876 RepID=I2GFU5_9BACT|nr:DUF3892 domain-containing protein [Fibrisoma limi]CCH52770.1 hypothetical protein BN8_01796 [Fibrisoma limi BUZ 3]